MSNNVTYPFGNATVAVLSASGAQAISIDNDLTIIDGMQVASTADRTINLTVPDDLADGAKIVLLLTATSTESTIFGDNIKGADVVGVAGKTKTVAARLYNGMFYVIGTPGQID